MKKKINIVGKRNIDTIKKMHSKEKSKRAKTECWNDIFIQFDYYKQVEYLNKLYLNEAYNGMDIVKKEIKNTYQNTVPFSPECIDKGKGINTKFGLTTEWTKTNRYLPLLS